jgi:N-terminal domain of anti-restriction factor ArdC
VKRASAERREEARRQLERAVEALAQSEGWRAWIRTRSTFRRYSLHNTILIAMQRPDATHVAGYRAWQRLGRQVRRGEQEGLDRCEKAVARVELTQLEPRRLSREERGQAVVVEHVIGLVSRHALLEEPEAVGVDRPDEEARQPVERLPSEAILDTMRDPVLQLFCCSLRERERDDRLGLSAVREQVHDPLCDDLRLARSSSRDDLEVPAAMANGVEGCPT